MNFKIIGKQGEDGYLVQYEEDFCLVNLYTGKYNKSKDVGVFLKWGYMEEIDESQVEEIVLAYIEEVLSDPENGYLIN